MIAPMSLGYGINCPSPTSIGRSARNIFSSAASSWKKSRPDSEYSNGAVLPVKFNEAYIDAEGIIHWEGPSESHRSRLATSFLQNGDLVDGKVAFVLPFGST